MDDKSLQVRGVGLKKWMMLKNCAVEQHNPSAMVRLSIGFMVG
jgi:hypothetical protein